MDTGGRGRYVVALLLLAALVNLPLVHGTWQAHRVSASGTDVTATVVHDRTAGGEHAVWFRFPRDVDPGRRTWRADVDAAAYDDAVASGEIAVRVLPGDPSAYRATGTVGSSLLLVATLVADLLLLVAALLLWRFGGRGPEPVSG